MTECDHITPLTYGYMVNQTVWESAGLGKAVVCPACLEKALGRALTVCDFSEKLDLPLNYKVVKRLFGTWADRELSETEFMDYIKERRKGGNECS